MGRHSILGISIPVHVCSAFFVLVPWSSMLQKCGLTAFHAQEWGSCKAPGAPVKDSYWQSPTSLLFPF